MDGVISVTERLLLVSEDMQGEIERLLGDLGYGCVRLPKCDRLDTPVASHPDMIFYRLSDGRLLTDRGYYEKNARLLKSTGGRFAFSEKSLDKKYPADILFDAFCIGGTVYGRTESVAPEISADCEGVARVSQGYAKCSTLALDSGAVTADMGIYKALTVNGVSALLIASGGIVLEGYGYGFIGGASFFDPISRTAVFFGDPRGLESYPEIEGFLKEQGVRVLYPEGIPLTDLGGAVIV